MGTTSRDYHASRRPSGLRKTIGLCNSLAHRTTWLRSDLANSFPKVSNPICRLPLPTFFHQLEAANLGDLLRLWVRSRMLSNRERPRIFKGQRKRTGLFAKGGVEKLYPSSHTLLRLTRFHGGQLVKSLGDGKREEKTPPRTFFNVFEFTYVAVFQMGSILWCWNVNQLPFRGLLSG